MHNSVLVSNEDMEAQQRGPPLPPVKAPPLPPNPAAQNFAPHPEVHHTDSDLLVGFRMPHYCRIVVNSCSLNIYKHMCYYTYSFYRQKRLWRLVFLQLCTMRSLKVLIVGLLLYTFMEVDGSVELQVRFGKNFLGKQSDT